MFYTYTLFTDVLLFIGTCLLIVDFWLVHKVSIHNDFDNLQEYFQFVEFSIHSTKELLSQVSLLS